MSLKNETNLCATLAPCKQHDNSYHGCQVNNVGGLVFVEDFFGRFGIGQVTVLGGQENPLLKTIHI
jgi:hypothetical protein